MLLVNDAVYLVLLFTAAPFERQHSLYLVLSNTVLGSVDHLFVWNGIPALTRMGLNLRVAVDHVEQ